MTENLRVDNHDCSATGGNDPWLIDNPDSGLPWGCGESIVASVPANKLYFGDNLTVLRDQIRCRRGVGRNLGWRSLRGDQPRIIRR